MPYFKEKKELTEQEKLEWLRLIRIENIGPITFYKLLESFGNANQALKELPKIAKRNNKKDFNLPSLESIENEYKRLKKFGGDIVCACEPTYSEALLACDDCPPVLEYIGNIKLLQNKKNIALIGNRNPTIVSKNLARKISAELGQEGFIISSGMASGIDTCAHEGALETGTIAVLGGGVDVIYPKENIEIYKEISKKGLIISEAPLGTQPIARHFPKRNRIVAGLANATVVIEAKLQSGSLITAKQALDYGRDVMAVPGHPLEPKAKGTNSLIQKQGASLVTSSRDIIDAMNNMIEPLFKEDDNYTFTQEPINTQSIDENDIEETKKLLLENYINYVPINVNTIVTESKLPINLILVAILDLELAGKIERFSGNMISKI